MAALPVGAGPEAAGLVGRAIGATGLFEGVRFGGGVVFSSTNSGCCSGIASGGGGGGGSSSGGGVGAGGSGAVSSDNSTASGMFSRSIGGGSLECIDAIATAAPWSASAPAIAAEACHRGGGR